LHEEEEEEGAVHDEEEEDAHSHATMESHLLTDTFGGRLVVETPVEGLSVGASAYTGDVSHAEHDDHEESEGGRAVTYGLQAEYDNGTFVLRTEYVRQDVENELEVDAAYVEASYMIYGGLQAAVRYDWSDTSLDEGDVDEAPSVLEHEDWGIGLNYWFNQNFVVKSSYHTVTGNRFAESEGEGGLEDETTLFSVGVAFSF
jgi:predicted porin